MRSARSSSPTSRRIAVRAAPALEIDGAGEIAARASAVSASRAPATADFAVAAPHLRSDDRDAARERRCSAWARAAPRADRGLSSATMRRLASDRAKSRHIPAGCASSARPSRRFPDLRRERPARILVDARGELRDSCSFPARRSARRVAIARAPIRRRRAAACARGSRVARAVISSARSPARDGLIRSAARRRGSVHASASNRLRQCSNAALSPLVRTASTAPMRMACVARSTMRSTRQSIAASASTSTGAPVSSAPTRRGEARRGRAPPRPAKRSASVSVFGGENIDGRSSRCARMHLQRRGDAVQTNEQRSRRQRKRSEGGDRAAGARRSSRRRRRTRRPTRVRASRLAKSRRRRRTCAAHGRRSACIEGFPIMRMRRRTFSILPTARANVGGLARRFARRDRCQPIADDDRARAARQLASGP